MIYCGYQGSGKSTYCRNNPDTTIDLDSSAFVKVAGWEENYVRTAVALATYFRTKKEAVAHAQKIGGNAKGERNVCGHWVEC